MLKTIASHLREIARVAGATQLEFHINGAFDALQTVLKDVQGSRPIILRKVVLRNDPSKGIKESVDKISGYITRFKAELPKLLNKLKVETPQIEKLAATGDVSLLDSLTEISDDLKGISGALKVNQDDLGAGSLPRDAQPDYENLIRLGKEIKDQMPILGSRVRVYFRK